MRLEHGHPVAAETGRLLQLHIRRDHGLLVKDASGHRSISDLSGKKIG